MFLGYIYIHSHGDIYIYTFFDVYVFFCMVLFECFGLHALLFGCPWFWVLGKISCDSAS